MKAILLLCLLCCALASCSKNKNAPIGSDGEGSATSTAAVSTSSLPQTLKVLYRGRNAEAWGKELLDADPQTSERASTALHQIGDEGLRFFVRGMESDIEHVRINSFGMNEIAKEYKSVFIPILTKMLDDKSVMVRYGAACVLANSGFKESLPAMKAALDKETNSWNKNMLAQRIAALESGDGHLPVFEKDIGNADSTFTLSVPSSLPLMTTSVKQGGTTRFTITVKRGTRYTQEIVLKFEKLPAGVTIDPAGTTIKNGQTDARLTLRATNTAAPGDYEIKVIGHPMTGSDASNTFKLTVTMP